MPRDAITIRTRTKVTVTRTRVTLEGVFKATARVCRVCDGRPGLRRERVRGGFRYRDPSGKLVRDPATLARIKALAIPPAWEDVWICPTAGGHLQATGRDARGRKQYRYHPAFRSAKDSEKFSRLAGFGRALPRIRRKVEADLARPGLPREKVLAAVVKLLDRTHLRVGNLEYVRANQSFGLSTLLDRHVSFTPGKLRVRFRGKSGVWHDREVDDPALARVVRRCRDLPGQDLFQYEDKGGVARPIGSADVNGYIRRAAGGPYTAKDFRTWAGTVKAAAMLAARPVPETKTAAERTVCGVIKAVATELGNTPAVCRQSYVHPRVIEAFAAGEMRAALRPRGGLSADERRVLRLLGRRGSE
jgi:DNA topoisomerase-1